MILAVCLTEPVVIFKSGAILQYLVPSRASRQVPQPGRVRAEGNYL
jgi:hypothetical protein